MCECGFFCVPVGQYMCFGGREQVVGVDSLLILCWSEGGP